MKNNRRVVIIDSNKDNIEKVKKEGIESYQVNIYDDDLTDNIEFNDVGYLLSITGSDSINKYAISNFADNYGEQGAYRIASSQEIITKEYENKEQLFTVNDDFYNLMDAVREFPEIHEIPVNSIEEYKKKINEIYAELKSIPILMKNKNNEILLISEFEKNVTTIEDWKLVYLGKKLNI